MSYELIGESVKSAISIKLGELFKVATNQTDKQGNIIYTYPVRYKENVTSPQYPSFYIIQVSCNMTPLHTKYEGALNKDLKRLQLDYLFNIKYRVAHDTELVTNLRQQLDAVNFKLLTEFTEINLERPVYTKNCRSEIVDGVLEFFCNITIYATNDQVDDTEQASLEIQEQIQQDNSSENEQENEIEEEEDG